MTAEQLNQNKPIRMKMLRRLLWSLPLMCLAGFCVFGFVATFEPMPTVERWLWRDFHLGPGTDSVLGICWMWLRPQRPKTT